MGNLWLKDKTEEEKKTFDELLSDHENMIAESDDLGISEPIMYIPGEVEGNFS